jgi:hypothetical protein
MVAEALRAFAESGGSRLIPLGWRRRRWVVASAAAVVVAGSAAAHYYTGLHEPKPAPTRQVATAVLPTAKPAPPVPPPAAGSNTPAAPNTSPATEAPAAPSKREARSARETDVAASKTAQDWLQRANELRASGQWRDAERAYGEVFRAYPSSGASYVARVSAATIRLDQLGDAGGARRLFRAADRGSPGGALDLEVQRGIAAASRRLGDRKGEVLALRAILDGHGSSRAAEQARARLDSLGE